jgi:hypothetical protein
MRKMFIIALALAPIVTLSSGAQAGGWIADNIIKPVFGEHAAREADKVHEQKWAIRVTRVRMRR